MHLRLHRTAMLCLLLIGLAALFPVTSLAAGEPPSGWPGVHLSAGLLGWLAPLALILLAVGATPPEEALDLAASALSALVVGLIVYCACGFALHLGGVYLQVSWPGLAGLNAEWSPVNPTIATGWGALGWRGFFLAGGAATDDAYALAAIQLPSVAMAVLIPTLALARRCRRLTLLALAAVVAGLFYPLAGNWVWGGGWLARLGLNTGWGHGFVDLGGAVTVHLLGASLALAGMIILGRRPAAEETRMVVELPPVHFPLFVLVGALLAIPGWLGLVLANPLVTSDLSLGLVALNLTLAALGGAAPTLFYSWLATARPDAQAAARGLVAGLVLASACCAFMPPFVALAAGLLAGALVPFILYLIEQRLRWPDPNAALAAHGLPGLLGGLWLVLFADGRYGVDWNGVSSRNEVPQGVSGLFVAPGFGSDIPGQLWAQLAGIASILLLALALPLLVAGLARGMQVVAGRISNSASNVKRQTSGPTRRFRQ